MDLIEGHKRQQVFEQKRDLLKELSAEHGLEIDCHKTSIWDTTLYRAWSKIVTQLISNREKFESELNELLYKSQIHEVFLFEKATYLNICYLQNKELDDEFTIEDNEDDDRFENISNALKNFKMVCTKNVTGYRYIECRSPTDKLTYIVQTFTTNTIIMLVSRNPDIRKL